MRGRSACIGMLLFILTMHIGGGDAMGFEIKSTAFQQDGMIPFRFTCDGEDASPGLTWSDPPKGTRSFALICDDPDAPMGTWVHWVVYNIPSDNRGLEESYPNDRKQPDGTLQGMTDFRKVGYGGPCPPGGTHRYYFKLYALDTVLSLSPGATKKELLEAMKGHQLAEAQLMGRYKRK